MNTSSQISLSVIIVSYNTKQILSNCLTSVIASSLGKYKIEIIVYDNGSKDGSPEMVKKDFPTVKIIAGSTNLGFAAANNWGIKISHGRYILLLNSDTAVNPESLKKMLDYMIQNPNVGASTCKLILGNGKIDPACHRGFPTPWAAITYFLGWEKIFPKSRLFSQYHLGYLDLNTIHEIDSPSGAFFMIRRELINTVGLLDEDYFMYAEDIDWAYRMKQKGYKIFYNPDTFITHYKKQSGRSNLNILVRTKTQIMFYSTMKLFYQKHYLQKYPTILNNMIFLLLNIRIGLIKLHKIE
jgi:GT2 family glycosyltransferase